jgi:DNA helicase IV
MVRKSSSTAPSYMRISVMYLAVIRPRAVEWPSVLVILEPSIRTNTEQGRRFAYTALTRGYQQLSLFVWARHNWYNHKRTSK